MSWPLISVLDLEGVTGHELRRQYGSNAFYCMWCGETFERPLVPADGEPAPSFCPAPEGIHRRECKRNGEVVR